MKTIGIIGGFGPEATAQFYLKLVKATRKVSHGNQPPVILRNVSVHRKLEHDALVNGKHLKQFIPLLTDAAKGLEQAGANCIVLPCNTLHVHEDKIRASITLPFISIIDSTVQFLRRQNVTRVGFLGSRITVRENLFKKQAKNIAFIRLDAHLQRKIDKGLDIFVEKQDSTLLQQALAKSFSLFAEQNIRDVLLACTDFHGLCPNVPNIRVHDTLDILVRATVNMCYSDQGSIYQIKSAIVKV